MMAPEDSPSARLLSLLRRERSFLIHGELDALDGLEEDKRDLITAFSTQPPSSAPILAQLKKQAAENAEFYSAVQDGLLRARQRIEEVRSVLSEMKTYTGDGTVTSESTVQPAVSRKA